MPRERKRCGNEGLAPVRLNRLETRSGLKKRAFFSCGRRISLSVPTPRLTSRGRGRAPSDPLISRLAAEQRRRKKARKNVGPARQMAPALRLLCNRRKTETRPPLRGGGSPGGQRRGKPAASKHSVPAIPAVALGSRFLLSAGGGNLLTKEASWNSAASVRAFEAPNRVGGRDEPGHDGRPFAREFAPSCSFGHNALINLDSGKWIEIFGRILALFGRAARVQRKRSEGDLTIYTRQASEILSALGGSARSGRLMRRLTLPVRVSRPPRRLRRDRKRRRTYCED
jgi:hypothetical protein